MTHSGARNVELPVMKLNVYYPVRHLRLNQSSQVRKGIFKFSFMEILNDFWFLECG